MVVPEAAFQTGGFVLLVHLSICLGTEMGIGGDELCFKQEEFEGIV